MIWKKFQIQRRFYERKRNRVNNRMLIRKFIKKEKEYEKIKPIVEIPLEIKKREKDNKQRQQKKGISSI